VATTNGPQESQKSLGAVASGGRRQLTHWLAIGASLLIASSGSSWLTYKYVAPWLVRNDRRGGFDSFTQPPTDGVARITGIGCRWGRVEALTLVMVPRFIRAGDWNLKQA
jgi:hypothetical protein